jgi:hypothetical protein
VLGLCPDLGSAVYTGRVGRRVDDGRLIFLVVVVCIVMTSRCHGPFSKIVGRWLFIGRVLSSRVVVARVVF